MITLLERKQVEVAALLLLEAHSCYNLEILLYSSSVWFQTSSTNPFSLIAANISADDALSQSHPTEYTPLPAFPDVPAATCIPSLIGTAAVISFAGGNLPLVAKNKCLSPLSSMGTSTSMADFGRPVFPRHNAVSNTVPG